MTTYYDWLQGLRFVPFGLVQLLFAAWLALPRPEGADAKGSLAVALLANMAGMLVTTGLYALVTVEKQFKGKTPLTRIAVTEKGREAVEQHWRQLEQLRGKARSWVPRGTE